MGHKDLYWFRAWRRYSSGAAALLVFECSVTGAVAPSYKVDWNEAMVL